jgi:hypothetical protein
MTRRADFLFKGSNKVARQTRSAKVFWHVTAVVEIKKPVGSFRFQTVWPVCQKMKRRAAIVGPFRSMAVLNIPS